MLRKQSFLFFCLFYFLEKAESGKPPKLSISKDIDDRVRVKNAVTLPAANEEDLLRLYCVGLDHRKKAETRMNSSSSRSHLLFMIWLEVFNKRANRKLIGKLTLVDLAGSERLSRSGVTDKTVCHCFPCRFYCSFKDSISQSSCSKKNPDTPNFTLL